MKTKQKILKTAALTNNCPECYANDGLHLSFYQKMVKTKWYTKQTTEITEELVCQKCNSTIYPVRWTDDIERVYDFYYRSILPINTSFQFSKLSYILMGVAIGFIVVSTTLIVLLNH
ncbi:hypothetical protein ACG2LH_01320 [Zhouia sp. PK063]|uniref:hypothetical protein n=1 Tax=Zhouia sp. PK063 TaxID=3373602 RepID=UPI0037B6075E